jgi:predicted ATP-grasp superfamily ATP-dependent carboligase
MFSGRGKPSNMSSPLTIVADEERATGGGEAYAHSNAGSSRPGETPPREVARLVILGSSVTALAVAREAHCLGLRPVIMDRNSGIAHRSSLVERAPFQEGSEADIFEQVRTLGGPDACLVSTADLWLRFLMRNREALEGAFRSVLHPSNEVLDICLSKAAFADWCLANRFDAPRYCRGDDAPCLEGIRYPVLVRPAETLHQHSRSGIPKAVEAGSQEELGRLIERFRAAGAAALVAESLLGQRLIQYSVPFARRGSEILSFVACKVRPPADWCSTGTCVELSPNAEVEALARRSVEALDYFGIGEVEILHSLDSDRSYLIEINARPWVQYSLATASGHNFLEFLLRPDRADKPPTVKRGLTWLYFSDDAYVCFSRSQGIVRRGRLSVLGYLRSVLRANVHALFSWSDPKPWLLESLAWLRSLANR